MVDQILDHLDLALDRLREQYKGDPVLAALLGAEMEQVQDLESAFQTIAGLALDTETGIQLDIDGRLVGVARTAGQSDDDYRRTIKAQIIQNITGGDPTSIISYMLLLGAAKVVLSESYPAAGLVFTDLLLTDQPTINKVYAQLQKLVVGGVRIDGFGYLAGDDSFAFAGPDGGKGFGDPNDATVGGQFAMLYVNSNLEFAFDGPDGNGGGFGTLADPLIGGVLL